MNLCSMDVIYLFFFIMSEKEAERHLVESV